MPAEWQPQATVWLSWPHNIETWPDNLDEAQAEFVAEHNRVGRNWIITTPNRLFPVESHTRAVGLHYRASWRSKQASFTRLLNRSEFGELIPIGSRVEGHQWSPTFTAVSPGIAS